MLCILFIPGTSMKIFIALATAALALPLCSCMTTSAQTPAGAPAMARCDADAAAAAIGKAATAEVVEQARVASGAQIVRVLRPGQAVTMEFREGRLNVDVNERNAVTGLRCG